MPKAATGSECPTTSINQCWRQRLVVRCAARATRLPDHARTPRPRGKKRECSAARPRTGPGSLCGPDLSQMEPTDELDAPNRRPPESRVGRFDERRSASAIQRSLVNEIRGVTPAHRCSHARVAASSREPGVRHQHDLCRRAAGDPQRRALAVAGDDAKARRLVAEVIDRMGYDPVDAGSPPFICAPRRVRPQLGFLQAAVVAALSERVPDWCSNSFSACGVLRCEPMFGLWPRNRHSRSTGGPHGSTR